MAALGVVAPVGRLPAERYGEVAEAVLRAARALSGELDRTPALARLERAQNELDVAQGRHEG